MRHVWVVAQWVYTIARLFLQSASTYIGGWVGVGGGGAVMRYLGISILQIHESEFGGEEVQK